MTPGSVFVVAGNSGAGKTTVVKTFVDEFADSWQGVVKEDRTPQSSRASWLERLGMVVFGRWTQYHQTPGALPEMRDGRLNARARIHYGALALCSNSEAEVLN